MATTVKFPPLDPSDLGTDVDVMDDFSPVWGLVAGRDNLGRAYYRRLNTPAGGLFYDATYGYDVKDLLNADLTTADISQAKAAIKAQLMLDERTQSVDVVLTFNKTLKTLTIAIKAETNDGPFSLILRATSVTLAVLVIDGVPVAPEIAPDFIAADVAETAAAVVFPPAPPAIGALVGAATINLSLAATAKQPVADSYLLFSGYADNSGLSQTHANRGATVDASFSQAVAYIPPACTLRSLRLVPLTNTRTVSTTFTVYKNGAATGVTVTVPAGSTAAVTDTHSVAFNGTSDTFSLVSSGSPTGHISFGATIETGPVRVMKFAGIHSHDVAETSYLNDITGLASPNAAAYIPPACTIVGLRVAVGSNKSTTRPVNVTVYKNGSPTSMQITIPAGSVSTYVDVTGGHAVSFNGSSDKLDVVSSRTGAGPTFDTQVFEYGPGTWVKPADARTVEDVEYGAGGGGASASNIGTIGSGGDSRGGGGAGGGGGANKNVRDASLLPASVAVTPGALGIGAPYGTLTAGTAGGDSSFGAYGTATGGRGGQPPTSGVGGVGGAGGTGNAGTGGSGGSGSAAPGVAGTAGSAATGIASGGGGGGGYGATPPTAGGAGGAAPPIAGGAGGASGGANGTDGTDDSGLSNIEQRSGSGGGGGAGAVFNSGIGGTGGQGGAYGGGGGGGGGASGTAPGGGGQSGDRGAVIVQTTIIAGDVALTATLELT